MRGYGFMGPGMMGGWNRNARYNPTSSNYGWGYGPSSMMGWSGNWWSWIAIIVILVVIAVVVVALVRSRRSDPDSSSDVLEILRSRYAEGKITREEYQRMLKELRE
ncbi:MAG TPA: hypothetical protein DHV69_04520 [Sphaerochaeta sp.]|nr:hypothetical protein [Sphaerochaeta sp.]